MRTALIISLCLAPCAWAEAAEVAMVTDLNGRVDVRQGDASWRAARLDQGLRLKDGMRTWERSSAEIRFVDGTVLMLTEQTRLRITTALFNPGETPQPIRVALGAGGVDVRTRARPLEVRAANGVTHRIEAGSGAHVRLIGQGTRASIIAGPPRMTASVDIAPVIAGRGAPTGGVELDLPGDAPGAEAAGDVEVAGGGRVVVPGLPAPVDVPGNPFGMDPMMDPPPDEPPPDDPPPDEPPPDPPPTGVRIQVEVRAGGDR